MSRSRSRSSHSRSPSKSRSRSPRRSRSRSGDRHGNDRGRVKYDTPNHLHGGKDRPTPDPSKCLGVFGMDWDTTEYTIFDKFSKFGNVDRVVMVKDHHTGRSRGFGFVYFEHLEDASKARSNMDGANLDGRNIRVDFSLTDRKTESFPGRPQGRGDYGDRRGGDRDGGRRYDDRGGRGETFGARHNRDRGSYNDRGGDRGYNNRDSYRDKRSPPRDRYRRSRSADRSYRR